MPLSRQERADLERDVSRIKEDIRSKEAILAGYERNPSMARYIPGIKNEISGLKRELQHCMDALRRGKKSSGLSHITSARCVEVLELYKLGVV